MQETNLKVLRYKHCIESVITEIAQNVWKHIMSLLMQIYNVEFMIAAWLLTNYKNISAFLNNIECICKWKSYVRI